MKKEEKKKQIRCLQSRVDKFKCHNVYYYVLKWAHRVVYQIDSDFAKLFLRRKL